MDCTRAVADVRDNGLRMGNDRFAATETGGEGEFRGVEFFLENVEGVVVRTGEAVNGLVAVADGDEVATWLFVQIITFSNKKLILF